MLLSRQKEDTEDEDIDLEKALTETKPNIEIAEGGEENQPKKAGKKKSSKKKNYVKKDEEVVDSQENGEEVVADDTKSEGEGE